MNKNYETYEPKPYYRTATDVAYYFRDKNSIEELVQFIFNESVEQIIEAKENNINTFAPVTFESISNSYRTDYQFIVHCIAKLISKKTKIKTLYIRVLNHFAIKSFKLDNQIFKSNRRFLMMLFVNSSLINYNSSFANKINYNNYFTPSIISYNYNIL